MDLSACDDSDLSCPLCLEEMDSTDRKFQPCHCGYQICLWCWHHIMEMANKDNLEGRCPACRSPYDKEKIVSASPAAQDEFSDAGGGDKKQKGKGKGRTNFGSGGGGGDIRKHLSNVRVVQRNLVYVVGMPMSLADEETLERREYFGQYGRVLKIAVSRSTSGISGSTTLHGATANVYVTFVKEEDAVRCIQAVDGCIFEGRTLRACFGTTKYCNAWLKNLSCNNPDCLYLHEIGTQEDSYTKEEMLHKYGGSKHHQYDAASMVSRRAANGLPPPLDGYSEKASYGVFSSGGSSRGVTSTSAAAAGGKVGGSGGGTSGGLLPAAASWGSKGSSSGKLVLSAPRPFGTSQVAPSPYANANGQVHSGAHGMNGPPSSLHAAAWPPPSSSTMPASSSSLNPSTLSPAIAIPGSVTQMYPYKPSAAVLSGRVIQASAHSPPVFSSGVGSGSGLSNSLGAGGQAVGIRGRSPYRERGRQKSPTASPFGSPPPPSFAMAASTQTSTSLSSTPIRSGGVTVLLRAPDPSLVAATSGLSSRLGSSTATSSGAASGGAQQLLEEATSACPSNRKGDGIIKQTDSESKAGPGSAKSGGGGKSGAGKAACASSSSSSSSGSSASAVATKSSSTTTSGGSSSSSTINSSASSSKSGSSSGATSNASSSGVSGGSSAGSKKSTKSSSLDDVALSATGGSKKAAKLSSSDDATTNSSTSGRSSSNSSTSMKGGASVSTATATSTTSGSSSSSSSSGSSSSSTSSSKSISSASSMMSSSNGGKASSSSSSSAGAATSAAGSSGAVSSRSGKSSSSVSASAKNASASSSSSSSIGEEEVMGSKGSDGTGATRSSSNAASATGTSSGPTSSATLTKPARGDAADEGGQPQGAAASLGTAKGKPRVTAAAKAEPSAGKEPESEAAAAASTERGRKKGRVEVEEASTSSSEGKADSCTAEPSVADAVVGEEMQATERAAAAEKNLVVEAAAASSARGGGAADAAEVDAREAASAKPPGGSEEEAGAARALDSAQTADGSGLSSTLPVADGAKAPPQAASMAAGKVTATTATLSAPPGFGMRPPRVQLQQQQQLALSAQTGSAGEAAGGAAVADRPVASVGVSQELRKHEQQHHFHMLAQQTQRQHGVGEPWLVHDSAIVSFSELNAGASAVSNLATQRLGVASRSDTSLSALEARGLQLSAVSDVLPPHPVEGSGRGGGRETQGAQRHNYVASQPSGLPTSISVPSLLASLGANSLSSLPSLGSAASSSYMGLPTISTQGFGIMPVPPLAAATVATPSLPLHARQLPLTGGEASVRAGVGLSNLSRALLGLGPRSQLGSVMPEVDESQVIADILQMDAVDELWRLPSLATSSAAAHPTMPAERAVPLAVDSARPEPAAAAAGGREDSVHGGTGSNAEALAAAGSSLARVLRSVSLSRSATDAARGGVLAGAGGDSQGRNGLLGGGAYAAASGPPKRSRFRFAQTEEEEQGGGEVQQAQDQARAHSQQLHELLQQQQVEQQLKQLLHQSQQQLKQQPLIEPQQQKGLWAFDVESRSAGLPAAEGVQAAAQPRSDSAVSHGGVGASQGQLSVPPGFGARRVFSSSPTPPAAAAVVAAGSAGPGAGAGAGAGGVGVARASSMGSVPQQPLPQPQTGG